jgi:acetylornithine deacetylase/succinyl-diaminopimelate desuccinylase-like protein
MTGDHRQRIHDFVAAGHDAQVAFLAELVKVPSDNPPGDCAAHGARAAELLEGLGLEVERHEVPAETARSCGVVSATNLIVRRRFGEGPVVALNAHGDVVPPGEGWSHDPYGAAIVEGCLYGRGAAVSKSDFATYTWALLALDAVAAPGRGCVELHFTHDEEAGGEAGPKWLLDQGLSAPDYVLSAGFSYGVVTAHNGCLHLEARLRGRQAHAAQPATGVDALEAATGVLAALYDHRRGLEKVRSQVPGIGSPSLVVGLIEGGVNTNVVPDLVRLRLDRRLIPEEDGAEVESGLMALIEQAGAAYPGIAVEVERVMLAQPLAPVAGTEALAEIVIANASAVLGAEVKAHGVPIYTDARHYAAAGIPTVLYGAGPRALGEANAHGADEHIRLEDLKMATEVVALTLHDLLSED